MLSLIGYLAMGAIAFIGAMYFSKTNEEKASTAAMVAALSIMLLILYVMVRLKIGVIESKEGVVTNIPLILLLLIGIPVVVFFIVYSTTKEEYKNMNIWEQKTVSELIESDMQFRKAVLLVVVAALVGVIILWGAKR